MKAFLLQTKNIFKALLLCLVISFFSCSKSDDAPAQPTQNPLAGYLSASGFDQKTTNAVNGTDYEFGYSFIPTVNGKMTAIVVKIPDARSGLRVTVWDKATATVLRTETLDVATAGVEVTKDIQALDLTSGKEYFITMNGNDWYEHQKTNGSNVSYPFTVGDIRITSYAYRVGTAQAIPNSTILNFYSGDCSFKFQK